MIEVPTKTIVADGIEIKVRPVGWRQWRQLATVVTNAEMLDAMEAIVDACATLPDGIGGKPSDVLTRRAMDAVFRVATAEETEGDAERFPSRPGASDSAPQA